MTQRPYRRLRRLALGLAWLAAVAGARAEPPPPSAPVRECEPRGGWPHFFARLAAKQPVRIAYLGGSITAAPGWRVLTLEWFRKNNPGVDIQQINAAVSGTGSDYGACRIGRDVLDHQPDLLFVEFAVNDGRADSNRVARAMEGLVRQAWRRNTATDVCFVYTLSESQLKAVQAGRQPPAVAVMESVASHYGIPSIHLGLDVARLVATGAVVFTSQARQVEGKRIFTSDGVHPRIDTGHPFYRDAIVRSLPALQAAHAVRRDLPPPLRADNWEGAHLLPLGDIPQEGWRKIPPAHALARRFADRLPDLWAAATGAVLRVPFAGTGFGVCGLKGPDGGAFRVTIDDRPPVDGMMFDHYCTDSNHVRIMPWFYPAELADTTHTARVEFLAQPPDRVGLLKKRGLAVKNPDHLKGNNLYLGAILVLDSASAPD